MTANKPEVFEVYRTRQGTLENVVLLADYEALQAELADMERDYLAIIEAQDAEHRKQLARLKAEREKLRKDAAFYRRLRSLTYEQLGQHGVPCVAVLEADNRGFYVSGEDLDAAMLEENK